MNTDPFSLDRLSDIAPGDEVSWWPLAPAWYALFVIILLQLLWFTAKAIRNYKANAYRRQALAELSELHAGDVLGLSVLLKRVALVAFPREEVASLSGSSWIQFLRREVPGTSFQSENGSPLENASTGTQQAHPGTETWHSLVSDAQRWIREHHQRKAAIK